MDATIGTNINKVSKGELNKPLIWRPNLVHKRSWRLSPNKLGGSMTLFLTLPLDPLLALRLMRVADPMFLAPWRRRRTPVLPSRDTKKDKEARDNEEEVLPLKKSLQTKLVVAGIAMGGKALTSKTNPDYTNMCQAPNKALKP